MSKIIRYTNSGHRFEIEGILEAGYTIIVTVIPADGYEFVQWLTGLTNITEIDSDDNGHRRFSIYIEECGLSFASLFQIAQIPPTPEDTCDKESIYNKIVKILYGSNTEEYLPWDSDEDITCESIELQLEKLLHGEDVEVIISTNGELCNVTGGGRFKRGSIITLDVTPDDYCEFVKWEDGNTENPRQIVATNNTTYKAICQYKSFSVEVVPDETIHGNIKDFTNGRYLYGTQLILEAIPEDEFIFDSWSDGSTDNPRILFVDDDITLTANFIDKPPQFVNLSTAIRPIRFNLNINQFDDNVINRIITIRTSYDTFEWDVIEEPSVSIETLDGIISLDSVVTEDYEDVFTPIYKYNDITVANNKQLSVSDIAYFNGVPGTELISVEKDKIIQVEAVGNSGTFMFWTTSPEVTIEDESIPSIELETPNSNTTFIANFEENLSIDIDVIPIGDIYSLATTNDDDDQTVDLVNIIDEQKNKNISEDTSTTVDSNTLIITDEYLNSDETLEVSYTDAFGNTQTITEDGTYTDYDDDLETTIIRHTNLEEHVIYTFTEK